MLIIPAIDLKGGKCVRLLRGDLAAETVYGEDPVAMARRWAAEGARYLHVVDLDGAVAGRPVHAELIGEICAAVAVPVEVGGGIRSLDDAARLVSGGADRVIFGTSALARPDVVRAACRAYPGHIAVGIDVRDGRVAVQGWTETTATEAVDLALEAERWGAACIIYTDISRDGTQAGVNVAATRALAERLTIPVIASGGVGSLADIEALLPCEPAGVAGLIVGRALYTGAVQLREALQLTARDEPK